MGSGCGNSFQFSLFIAGYGNVAWHPAKVHGLSSVSESAHPPMDLSHKSYNETGTHKNRRIAHPWVFRGTASATFVPAQGLRAQGNSLSPHPRPLSTAVLARNIGKVPKHHESACAKSRDVNSTGDFTASRHGQPTATLLRKGDSSVVCILTILLL